MEEVTKRNALCAWCGDAIINEKGFVIDGKERIILNIRDNIVIVCNKEHAKLYINLPDIKCHFMSPHNCKLVPPNIAIATVECDCPAKHVFCCQEIKNCFITDTSPREDNEIEKLKELYLDLILNETNVIMLEDKKYRCKTCKCGYKDFKECVCGEMRCSICHTLDRCIVCSKESYTQIGLRYTGLRYMSSFVVTLRNPNKTPDKCPQCYTSGTNISYLLSPCGHMCCSICSSKKIKKCNVCKVEIKTIDMVFLRYWCSKDYKPESKIEKGSIEMIGI